MVNTRNQTREEGNNTPRIQLRSAINQGDDAESRSHNNFPPNVGQREEANVAPILDATILEAIKTTVVQTMQELLRSTPLVIPGVVHMNQDANTGMGKETFQAPIPNNGSNFSRALKTFTSMRPDSYDGTGEPVKIAYWFSHMERLFRSIKCTEAEQVHIASLQLKDGASEWWEGTGLADHPELSWRMFKDKMMDRFFSISMREEKLKEFLYPEVEGLTVTEHATKFNHLLHYAGLEVNSEQQKIMRFHEWMSPEIKPLLVRHGYSSLEEYVDLAYKLEATLEESVKKIKGQQKPISQGPSFGGFKRPALHTNFEKSSRARTEMTQSRTTQSSSHYQSSTVCYNCGKAGHISSTCQKNKKKCFGCGKEGHMQTFCPQKELGAGQTQQASVVHSNRVPTYPTRSNVVHAPTEDKGKAPLASSSQGQHLYMMYQPDAPQTLED